MSANSKIPVSQKTSVNPDTLANSRALHKLGKEIGSIRDMRGLPDVSFVIDKERTLAATPEPRKFMIPGKYTP